MAIYQRLKRNEVDISTLRDNDGELTTEGVQYIRSMFDSVHVKKTDSNDVANATTLDVLQIQIEALTRERDLLLEQLEHERENTAHWREFAQGLLPAPTPPAASAQAAPDTPSPLPDTPSPDKPSLLQRIRNRFGKNP